MSITLETVGTAMLVTAFLVSLMTIHYLIRTGRHNDPICVAALLAAQIGLYRIGRTAEAAHDLLDLAVPGLILALVAAIAWREGLRRAGGRARRPVDAPRSSP
jgi:hypothetical protein